MKVLLFFVVSLIGFSIFSQIDAEAPLRNIHIDKELLVKYGIKSLSVYAEMDEREIDGKSTYSGKLREFEFDANGNTNYRLTASNGGNAPFLYYDKGSRPEYFKYNLRGLLVYHFMENLRESKELINEYDQDGHLTVEQVILKGGGYDEWNYKRTFEWVDGEMKKTIDVFNAEMPGSEIVYDRNGRCAEITFTNSKTTYDYEVQADTLITTRTDYREDTLVSTLRFAHIINDKDRVVSSLERNYRGELQRKLVVKYDAFGNATNHYFEELMEDYDELGRSSELVTTETEVVNKYDDRGFLVKQHFYQTSTYRPKKSLFQINHFCYESIPLVYKFEKGAISKKAAELEPMNDY